MFETLKNKLSDVFDGLARRGALSESDVDAALREVRLALLDADVALPVVKTFTQKVRDQAVGVASMRAVRPDQQVIKIVHDALIEMLGALLFVPSKLVIPFGNVFVQPVPPVPPEEPELKSKSND